MSTFDYSDFWNEALRQIHDEFKQQGKEQDFILWFNIEYVSSVQGIITLSVPSLFYRDRLQKLNYISLIENKLYELLGQPLKTEFIIRPRTSSPQNIQGNQQAYPQNNIFSSFDNNTSVANNNTFYSNQNTTPISSSVQINSQFSSQELQCSTAKNYSSNNIAVVSKHPQLRSDYLFSSFVKGNNNSFAYNAALAVSNNPGKAYNPLLIYGGVGLGKTHLMQAIGNEIYSKRGGKIIYVTAETFTNEFIQSIQTNTTTKFKNTYRNADALLIDDIHFLQNKKETQEELFYAFDALYNANKQLVFTCDRPLVEIKNISDRLRSRFERGLNVDLQPPDFETRKAILSKKLENNHVSISQEIIDLVAKNVATNVRDLEASLTKLIAYSDLLEQELTLEIAQSQLKDTFGSPQQGNITVETIQKVVAESFGISFIDLKKKKRTKNIVLPRQIAMYICKELTEFSTTELGADFGGFDHTTVMHSIDKVENAIKADPTLDTRIQSLIRKIKESSN